MSDTPLKLKFRKLLCLSFPPMYRCGSHFFWMEDMETNFSFIFFYFFKYPNVCQLTFLFIGGLGIKVHIIKFKPINCFQLFSCNEFLKHLVIKANLYAGQFFLKKTGWEHFGSRCQGIDS